MGLFTRRQQEPVVVVDQRARDRVMQVYAGLTNDKMAAEALPEARERFAALVSRNQESPILFTRVRMAMVLVTDKCTYRVEDRGLPFSSSQHLRHEDVGDLQVFEDSRSTTVFVTSRGWDPDRYRDGEVCLNCEFLDTHLATTFVEVLQAHIL